MNIFTGITALVLVIFTAGLMITLTLSQRKERPSLLRDIPALIHLKNLLGLAVEQGSRIHVSLGKSSIIEPTSPSSLSGLASLEYIGKISSVSDRPPIATSGDGALTILSQDTMRSAFRTINALELYDPSRGRLTGITPMSYIAGTLPVARQDNVSAHILVGNFGPEVALLVDAAERQGAVTVAGSDSLPAQAVLFAASTEPLIGEEIFAVPAYLEDAPMKSSSLKVQDILRWMVITGLLAGSVLKLVGIL
jgi:hypothetical protein